MVIYCSKQQHTLGAFANAMSADVLRRVKACVAFPSYFFSVDSSKFETE